ncbi:hypothetical protein FRC11_010981, partial [Ceratobasidium sp. 423]
QLACIPRPTCRPDPYFEAPKCFSQRYISGRYLANYQQIAHANLRPTFAPGILFILVIAAVAASIILFRFSRKQSKARDGHSSPRGRLNPTVALPQALAEGKSVS